MQSLKSFVAADGTKYHIPQDKEAEFRADFGEEAQEAKRYRAKDGTHYTIPAADDEAFRADFPDAQETRRMSMADGSTRDFTMPELSKYLRSKEYRESRDYTNKPDVGSPALAAIKGFGKEMFNQLGGDASTIRETAAETGNPLYKGYAYAQDLANSFLSGLLGGGSKITEGLGNAIGDNAVGRALVNEGRAGQATLQGAMPSDMLDTSGNAILNIGKQVAGVTGEFLPASIPGVGQAYAASVVAAGAVNRAEQVFEAASQNGMSPVVANALALGAGGVDAVQNMLLMGKFKGIWGGETKAAADAAKVGMVRRLLTDSAKTGATMGEGAMLGDVANQIAGIDEEGKVVAPKPFSAKRVLKAGFDGFIEGGMFHLVNSAAHSMPKAVQWVSEAKERSEARQMAIQSYRDALDTPEGRTLVFSNSPEAAYKIFEARRKGEDVSRKMLKALGVPDGVAPTAADRNALGDALMKDYDAYKKWQLKQPDKLQSQALDDTILTFAAETAKETTDAIREKVLGKIEDAKELDDPEKRERLVGEAFEEWAKENPQPKRAEEPPKATEKPAENAEPPKTGNEPPKPAEGVEAPSRASGEERTEETVAKEISEAQSTAREAVKNGADFYEATKRVKELQDELNGLRTDRIKAANDEEVYKTWRENVDLGDKDLAKIAAAELESRGYKPNNKGYGWVKPDGKGKMVKPKTEKPKENDFISEIEREANKKVALNEEAGGIKEPLDEATKSELKVHYVFDEFEHGISDSGKLSSKEGVGEVFDTFKNLVEKYNPPRDENGTVITQSVRRAAWMIESSAFATPEQKAFAHKYGEKYGTAADKPKPTNLYTDSKEVAEALSDLALLKQEMETAYKAGAEYSKKTLAGLNAAKEKLRSLVRDAKTDDLLATFDGTVGGRPPTARKGWLDFFGEPYATFGDILRVELEGRGYKYNKKTGFMEPIKPKPDGKGKVVKPAPTEGKKSKQPKANVKKAAKIVEDFVAKDTTRPSLTKPFYDKKHGVVVATDGRVLIATKHGYDENADNGNVDYPNWPQVVPAYKDGEVYKHTDRTIDGKGKFKTTTTDVPVHSVKLDPSSVAETCKKAIRLRNTLQNRKSDTAFVAIELPGGEAVMMDAEYMLKVAKAMEANGITEIKAISGRAPILAKNADTTIVAMPMRAGDQTNIMKNISVGREGTKIIFDAATGRLVSAPKRNESTFNTREYADSLRKSIEKDRANSLEWARKTSLYSAVLKAWESGETDARKVYESVADGAWDKLSPENRARFEDWMKAGDKDALAQKIADYEAERNPITRKGRNEDIRKLEKIEKILAAEDEIDALIKANETQPPSKGEKKETSPTRLESLAPTEDMSVKDEKAKFQKIEPITPEQEIEERVDLRRLDPKRRSDPKVLEWAKKHGRTITDGMVTPDAVREYDETMTEAAGRAVKRWFPDMKIVTHKFGEKIKRGQHVLEQKMDDFIPFSDADIERTKKEFGTTDDIGRAGFVAPDGSLIDLRRSFDGWASDLDIATGKRSVAPVEHGEIGWWRDPDGFMDQTGSRWANAEYEAIAGGMVRLRPEVGMIEVGKRLTDSQKEAIRDFCDRAAKSGRLNGVTVAVSTKEGFSGFLHVKNFSGSRVLHAIEEYFSTGKINGATEFPEINYLRDTSGRTLGWFDPNSKEVHLLPGADPKTVAHEIMWHGTRDYISQLAAKGDARAQRFLDMMHDVEKNIPEELKRKVLSLYARGGMPVSQDTLMNEFGAWFTMEKGGKALEQAMKTAEGRNWFAKAFHTVKEMYKDFLSRHGGNRVDLSAVDSMTREEFVDWLAEQFASGKTLGNIKGEPKKVLSTEETKLQAYRRKAYDNNAAVRDLERDIEKKTGRKISADESVEAANALKYGLKEAANIEVQGKMAEFRKVLDESGIHYADLEYYAALKAAAGRDAKIDKRNIDKLTADMKAAGASAQEIASAVANYKSTNGSHIDPREARKMLAEIENGADAAKYKKAYDELRKIIDETLVVQEQAGLVGKGDAEQWRAEEPNYVPFKNEYDAETGEWNGRGSSLNLTRPEHQMAKGRQSAAGDIIAHVFMDHQAAKHRAIENAVRQKLAKLVRAHKELGKVEILDKDAVRNIEKDDPNVVVFKEGGRAYAIRLEGTRGAAIANAFTQRNLLKMRWADKGFSVFGKKVSFRNFARWSSGMATRYSPTFSIRNTTKDNIELANIVYSERGPIAGTKWMGDYIANRAKMAKTLAKYVTTGKVDAGTAEGAILDRYIKAGGLIAGGVQAEGVASIKAKLSPDAIAKEMRRGKSKTAAAAKHVLKSIEYLNEYAEMATRLGAFATEVKGGKSDAEAALFSRRVTVDFNRHGDYTPAFSVFRLFSNSTLGATARAAGALVKSKYGAAAAATMFANGLAQAFIEHEYNADEDKRRRETGEATGKDVSEYDRKTALFYFRKGDKVYRVAQHESPFSLITYAGNCVGRWMCGELDGKDVAKNLGVSAAELAYNFTPMGQINLTSSRGGFVNDFKAAIISGIVPSALQPIAEIAWNMDYKGDTIQRQLFNNADPRSYNGKDSSPEWSKFLAERMNDATGGNAGRQGWVDISPEVIQKLVEGYGKNAMRDISSAISVGDAIIKGELPKLDVRNKPVKRDFVRPLDGNDRRYNDALSAYKADVNELSRMEESWTDEEYNAYIDAHPWVKDRSTKKDIEEIGKLRKLERGYIFRNGKAVPHEWTEEELKEFKAERLERQARVLQDMGR